MPLWSAASVTWPVGAGCAGLQPGHGDHDEAVDCVLGGQAACGTDSVETVARKLLGRDILPEMAGLRTLGQQVLDETGELLLRPGDVFTPVKKRRKFGAVVLVGNECVGLENSFEPLAGIATPVPDRGEVFEVRGDLTFMPREQDRLDVREVLVQRRPPDFGGLGDLRHRHRQKPMLGHQRGSGVQGRVAHGAAVRFDRLVPKLRHHPSIRNDEAKTL